MRRNRLARWIAAISLFAYTFYIVQAGDRVRSGRDYNGCNLENYAKFGVILKKCYGHDSLRSWMLKRVEFYANFDVDSTGTVIGINKFGYEVFNSGRRGQIDTAELSDAIKRKKIKFDFCYFDPDDYTKYGLRESITLRFPDFSGGYFYRKNLNGQKFQSRYYYNIEDDFADYLENKIEQADKHLLNKSRILYGQQNWRYNCAKFGAILKECFGLDSLRHWLTNGYSITGAFEIDSTGAVTKVVHLGFRPQSGFFTPRDSAYAKENYRRIKNDTTKILEICKQKNIVFDFCYDSEQQYQEFGLGLYKGFTLSFPGNLVIDKGKDEFKSRYIDSLNADFVEFQLGIINQEEKRLLNGECDCDSLQQAPETRGRR